MADIPLQIIGVGNPLMGDDGIGIVLLEQLSSLELPQGTELIDGGCAGLNLLPLLQTSSRLLFIDAADFRAEPASVQILGDPPLKLLPEEQTGRLSHQQDLSELLRCLQQLNPSCLLTLFLVQVDSCRLGQGLSPVLREALPEMLEKLRQVIS